MAFNPLIELVRLRMNAPGGNDLTAAALELNAGKVLQRVNDRNVRGFAHIQMEPAGAGPHRGEALRLDTVHQAKIGEAVVTAVARINISHKHFVG
jgi:hypothetical protein